MSLKSHYGTTFGAQGNLKPVPDRIATMVKMGIGNMRLMCSWDAIELKDPNTGEITFDFSILDGVITLANQAGIAVTYCLDSAPEWHQDSTLCSGKNFMKPEDAAAFLAMIAHRYTLGDPTNPGGLYIIGIEGANEGYSDGADHCQIGPYAAQLMKAVYPAVKAVNPNLVVGSPAIIGLQMSYITAWYEAFYSNGGLSDYDHFHYYDQQVPSATPPSGMVNMEGYYQAIAVVQAKYGHGSKPIRCTEVGIAVPGKSNTTWRQQSDFYLAALDIARQSQGKLEMVCLFTIGAGGFSPVQGEGDNEVEHELVAAHASYVKQYPTWDTLGTGGGIVIPLNSKGEIIDVNEADQFQVGKSQFECGFFAVAEAKSMAQPGQPPTLSVTQIISDAEGWYAQYDGTDAITNTNGMTLPQLYNLLQEVGLHYQSTTPDSSIVKQWIQAGYPVIIALTESSVHDLALGDANPYPWTPAGTHIILVTGVTSNGNVLVRDSANCTNLYDPNSLRPGPRTYDVAKLVLVSATVVVPPWMPRPTSSTPPAQKGENMNIIPVGWHDDGHTLTAPNGVQVVLGFRAYVLSHNWESDNYPIGPQYFTKLLEDSNPALGEGDQILFRRTMLGYPHNPQGAAAHLKDTVIEEFVGSELVKERDTVAKYYAAIGTLTSQLQAAQQQIQQLQSQQQGNPQDHALLLQVKQLVAPIS